MTELEILQEISEGFGYKYKVHSGKNVVMDDFFGLDHKPTLEILGKTYCGHFEYELIKDAILDWRDFVQLWKTEFPDLHEAIEKMYGGIDK